MKSVGEAMAIGRTFHESMQKALASMETGLTGFDEIEIEGVPGATAVDDGTGDAALHGHAIDKAITRRAVQADARPAARHRPGHAPRASTA